jgi:hypothetical protein
MLATIALLAGATPAAATPPEKEAFSFLDSFTAPAGRVCDFTLRDSLRVEGFVIVFLNGDGDPVREVEHIVATVTHTNVDTGARLVERLPLNSQRNFVSNFGQTVGLQWNLVDENGKKVLVVAGRVRYTLDPFEVLSITQHMAQYFFDYAGTLCPRLGGHPA